MSDDPPSSETNLVWDVETAESWPADDLLGDDPTKLVARYETSELSEAERSIHDALREMGQIDHGEVLCYGGLTEFESGQQVDAFDVHEALVKNTVGEGGAIGELVEVLNEDV